MSVANLPAQFSRKRKILCWPQDNKGIRELSLEIERLSIEYISSKMIPTSALLILEDLVSNNFMCINESIERHSDQHIVTSDQTRKPYALEVLEAAFTAI